MLYGKQLHPLVHSLHTVLTEVPWFCSIKLRISEMCNKVENKLCKQNSKKNKQTMFAWLKK
jgi:hypothetical protein